MRYTKDISAILGNERYDQAKKLLTDILHRTPPANVTVTSLYGTRAADFIGDLINRFLSTELPALPPRTHIPLAPTEISDTRRKLEDNRQYQRVQCELLQGRLPEVSQLRVLYGDYSQAVRNVLKLFLDLGLKRKCDVYSAAHLNRVGALAGALGLDKERDNRYSAIGVLHDAIEDLLNLANDSSGKPYGLARYDDFITGLLPADLREALVLLTNHYDLILGHIHHDLRIKNRIMTRELLFEALDDLCHDAIMPQGVRQYGEKMQSALRRIELDTDVLESAKWWCYRELYVHGMARTAHAVGDYRTYEMKALDIADNANGRDALAMSGRVKNILKMDIWAREGYALGSSWPPLNNHIMELEEDALVHAEHLIIRDFLEPVCAADFVMSGLMKIKKLQSVFFVNEGV